MFHRENFDAIERINVSKLEVRSTDFHKNCQTIKKFVLHEASFFEITGSFDTKSLLDVKNLNPLV